MFRNSYFHKEVTTASGRYATATLNIEKKGDCEQMFAIAFFFGIINVKAGSVRENGTISGTDGTINEFSGIRG